MNNLLLWLEHWLIPITFFLFFALMPLSGRAEYCTLPDDPTCRWTSAMECPAGYIPADILKCHRFDHEAPEEASAPRPPDFQPLVLCWKPGKVWNCDAEGGE